MKTELVDGVDLEVGDEVEYVGTSHKYSTVKVKRVESLPYDSARVSFDCPYHGRHDHLYTPGVQVRRAC